MLRRRIIFPVFYKVNMMLLGLPMCIRWCITFCWPLVDHFNWPLTLRVTWCGIQWCHVRAAHSAAEPVRAHVHLIIRIACTGESCGCYGGAEKNNCRESAKIIDV